MFYTDAENTYGTDITTSQYCMDTLVQRHFVDLNTLIDAQKNGKQPYLDFLRQTVFWVLFCLKMENMTMKDTHWG